LDSVQIHDYYPNPLALHGKHDDDDDDDDDGNDRPAVAAPPNFQNMFD